MKYIIYEENGLELPLVFPEGIKHFDIVCAIRQKVVSAGFCNVRSSTDGGEDVWIAHGKSTGLCLESRPQDNAILTKMMNFRW